MPQPEYHSNLLARALDQLGILSDPTKPLIILSDDLNLV